MTSVQGVSPSGGPSVVSGANGKANGNGATKVKVNGIGHKGAPWAIRPRSGPGGQVLEVVLAPGLVLPAGRLLARSVDDASLTGGYLAQVALHELIGTVGPMVWSDGQFLAYSAGVFRPVTSTALRTRLSALHGRPLSGSVKDKRRITITQRVIGDTLGCLRDLLAEPTQQVFTGQPSGVAFRDVFVKIDGGRGCGLMRCTTHRHDAQNSSASWTACCARPTTRTA